MRALCLIVAAVTVSSPAHAQRLVLDSGAIVLAHLEGRTLKGEVRQRFTDSSFTDSSSRLVLCPLDRRPCPGTEDLLSLPLRSIKRLAVHGRPTGLALLGFYVGALVGIAATRKTDAGVFAGGFGGMALGAFIDSKSPDDWVPIFPCAHACAGGHYPQPARR